MKRSRYEGDGLLVLACTSTLAGFHGPRSSVMCDCGGLEGESSACYLGGCYCNRDEAAAEARAMGLLVRCGGGLPCTCNLVNAAAAAAGVDPLAATLGSIDPSDPNSVNDSVETDFVLSALGDGVGGTLVPPATQSDQAQGQKMAVSSRGGCCGARVKNELDAGAPEPSLTEIYVRADAVSDAYNTVDRGGRPVKRQRCQCFGEGGPLCVCGPNCACLTADVEMASQTIMALASNSKTATASGGGGSCCCAAPNALPTGQDGAEFAAVPDMRGDSVAELSALISRASEPGVISDRGQKRLVPESAPVVFATEVQTPHAGSCCGPNTSKVSTVKHEDKPNAETVAAASANGSSKGTRPYACQEPGCNARFVFKQNRDRHLIEVHQPERRPFVCQHVGCAAAFKNSSGLKQHESTVHQKNRPFKCEECNASFGQRNHLTQHTKAVHLGRRPFACTVCEARFSNRGNLNQHVRRRKHHPPQNMS